MGVTIHYAGQLRDGEHLTELLTTSEEYARTQDWGFRVTSRDDSSTDGFVINPHPDCEPLEIRFGKKNRFGNWVKTQFAGPEIHIQIVQFLKLIKPIVSRMGVSDEGEFWKTGDENTLRWHMRRIDELIAEAVLEDPKTRSGVKTPEGRIIDLIS